MAQLSREDASIIQAWGARHAEVEKIWLFGSYARNEALPTSDIDLAIETIGASASESEGAWMDGKDTWRVELAIPSREIDLHWFDPEADLDCVGTGVKADGRLLYAKP